MSDQVTCPVLARAKLDKTHCDFPELCRLPVYCFWAHFHRIDPQTGKPVKEPPCGSST